jgi:hypothetical protein
MPKKQDKNVEIVEIEEYPNEAGSEESEADNRDEVEDDRRSIEEAPVEQKPVKSSTKSKKATESKKKPAPSSAAERKEPVLVETTAPAKQTSRGSAEPKPLSEKRKAALAKGRETQRLLREKKKTEALETLKKQIWEDFQKQSAVQDKTNERSSAGRKETPEPKKATESKKEPPRAEPSPPPRTEKQPLDHIKKMREALPKTEELKSYKHSGLYGPMQIRSFRKIN